MWYLMCVPLSLSGCRAVETFSLPSVLTCFE
jgi:hypothetical protein